MITTRFSCWICASTNRHCGCEHSHLTRNTSQNEDTALIFCRYAYGEEEDEEKKSEEERRREKNRRAARSIIINEQRWFSPFCDATAGLFPTRSTAGLAGGCVWCRGSSDFGHVFCYIIWMWLFVSKTRYRKRILSTPVNVRNHTNT